MSVVLDVCCSGCRLFLIGMCLQGWDCRVKPVGVRMGFVNDLLVYECFPCECSPVTRVLSLTVSDSPSFLTLNLLQWNSRLDLDGSLLIAVVPSETSDSPGLITRSQLGLRKLGFICRPGDDGPHLGRGENKTSQLKLLGPSKKGQ